MSKKELILKAAVEVFGEKGFRNATTDEIAKKAGVAKGLIFHYFRTKKELYYQTYVFVSEKLRKEFEEFMQKHEDEDIFVFMEKWMEKKITYSAEHPEVFNFLITLVSVDRDLQGRILRYLEAAQRIFFDFIRKKLKNLELADEVTEDMAFKLLWCFSKGFEEGYILKIYQGRPDSLKRDIKKISEEAKVMFRVMKRGLLKKQ
ncbi:TetR/AcrR family transcriptional regulator [Thermotoga sp.]|uniref:TetR/AcrR family transcriptional regulator n=1 Tax=Thermotoga sp. TaxID=28240 RepID=UPI0025D3D197|nr:TetR/AcrR family transcriptional regulator [Thermotoga sp.]MCD6551183.1 TetR/AcrR family transcriptional regulator [Thermotoga sp.]